MITLITTNNQKVLLNPTHIILVREMSNSFGEPYVEIYHSAAKAPLHIKESLDDIHSVLHQHYKN